MSDAENQNPEAQPNPPDEKATGNGESPSVEPTPKEGEVVSPHLDREAHLEASSSEEGKLVSDKPEDTSKSPAVSESPKYVKLEGLYLFKKGMSLVYDDKGWVVSVTVLEYKPSIVSQVKTDNKDGYQAIQVACMPKRRASVAEMGHLKPSGMENGARVIKEIRQPLPEGVCVGQKVQIESLVKGDRVNVMGYSKGRGFSGVLKRWNLGGGPASHGSTSHRRPGSIGNCEKPGRVMAGRKMPGHFGVERVTILRTHVVEVIPEENVVLVKGPIPGSMNSLVRVMKV